MPRTKLETIPARYEGKVLSIRRGKFNLNVLVECINENVTKRVPFKVWDITADLLFKNVNVGDIITGNCMCNLRDSSGKTFNKIITYNIAKKSNKIPRARYNLKSLRKNNKDLSAIKANYEKTMMKNARNRANQIINHPVKVFIMEGKITNINNVRDNVKKNQVSFCFKSFDRKRVDYIAADKNIINSNWFKKDKKVFVEVYEDPRIINFKNRTLQLLNMWPC